jgi:dihydrofolate reductase
MAKNRVIGINNSLPWHLPADLKHFRALTMGHHIIMGRKTFESIGKPLPGRTSVIITRNENYAADGILLASSLNQAISMCAEDSEIFIIGGAELYRSAIEYSHRIYLTEIDAKPNGDTFFIELEPASWQETSRVAHEPDEKNAHAYQFVTLDKLLTPSGHSTIENDRKID